MTCEMDDGFQTLALKLPAVITAGLRLNTPRVLTVANIIKARQKPLIEMPIAGFGLDLKLRLRSLSIDAPKPRQRGMRVATVAELVEKLRQEAKVL